MSDQNSDTNNFYRSGAVEKNVINTSFRAEWFKAIKVVYDINVLVRK